METNADGAKVDFTLETVFNNLSIVIRVQLTLLVIFRKLEGRLLLQRQSQRKTQHQKAEVRWKNQFLW